MKILVASMIAVGSTERTSFPLTEILIEGTIDVYNKTLIKRGIPYQLETLQWEILDAPEVIVEPPVVEPPVEEITPENPVEPNANEVQ